MFALQQREPGRKGESSSAAPAPTPSAAAGSQAQLDAVCGPGPGYTQSVVQRPSGHVPQHWNPMEVQQWGPRMRGPSPSPGSQTISSEYTRPRPTPTISMPPPSAFGIVEHQPPSARNTPSPATTMVSYCYTLALTYMSFVKITPKMLRKSVSASLY